MAGQVFSQDGNKAETAIMLGVLNAVELNATITQRSVAKELGIALGLANSYVKRCIKKGLIKAQQAPANRYAYYLTPQGFAEKSRLAAEYLSQGFQFYRIARQQLDVIYTECDHRMIRKVALCGLTDLAEIAIMAARDRAIAIELIVDDATGRKEFTGIPIVPRLETFVGIEGVVITDLGHAQATYRSMLQLVPNDLIFVPNLLNVSRVALETFES